MTPLIDLLLSNALMMVPVAVVVAIVARFFHRPAVIHVLWVIVLLKLVSPQFYQAAIPGLGNTPGLSEVAGLFHGLEQQWGEPSTPVKSTVVATDSLAKDSLSQHASSERMGVRPPSSSQVQHDHTPAISRAAHSPVPSAGLGAAAVRIVYSLLRADRLRQGLLWVWSIGAGIFVCTLAYRARCFHRFVKRAPLADETVQAIARSIANRYQLGNSPDIRVASGEFPPLLWVIPGSASIVLPRALLNQLDSAAIKHLLAHEMAHFARGDHWVRLLESIVLGIYWWHPVVWWARRQLQHAEEQCCDAWVLWACPKSETDYARTLLATLDYLSGPRSSLPPLSSGLGRASLIRRRFEMILHHRSRRTLSRRGIVVVAVIALAVLPCSAVAFSAGEQEPVNQAEAAESSSSEQGSQPQIETRLRVEELKRRLRAELSRADFAAGETLDAKEVHRVVRTAIRLGMVEAREGLQNARANATNADQDWLRTLKTTFDALNSLSDQEVEEIANHFELAMEHFGQAVEKSAEVFGRAVEGEFKRDDVRVWSDQKDSLAKVLHAIQVAGDSEQELESILAALDDAMESIGEIRSNPSLSNQLDGIER